MITEMLKAAGDVYIDIVTDVMNAIIHGRKVPSDWQVSSIVNSFKGKGEAIERGSYRGLKLLEQVMKVVERNADRLIREQMHIDS